jgi:hypothetical protein
MKMSRGEGVVEDPTPGGRASPRAVDPVYIVDPFQHVIGSILASAKTEDREDAIPPCLCGSCRARATET